MSWGARFLDAIDSEGKVKPEHRRRVALALAAYATNDGRGRDVGDPVHEAITEGRRLANEQRRAKEDRIIAARAAASARMVEARLQSRRDARQQRQQAAESR